MSKKPTGLDIMLYLLKAMSIVVIVMLMVVVADEIQEQQAAVYHEVYLINHKHQEELEELGIEKIEYYDWEETAHSLNIPIDSLTISIFMKHIGYVY